MEVEEHHSKLALIQVMVVQVEDTQEITEPIHRVIMFMEVVAHKPLEVLQVEDRKLIMKIEA